MSIIPISWGSGESGVAKFSSSRSVDRDLDLEFFLDEEATMSDILGGGGGTDGRDDDVTPTTLFCHSAPLTLLSLSIEFLLSPIRQGGG